MEPRTEISLAVKDGIDVDEIISTIEDNGYDVEYHATRRVSNDHADVHSYSVTLTTSTVCPECGEPSIFGTQDVGETETETLGCPNNHEWKRKIPDN